MHYSLFHGRELIPFNSLIAGERDLKQIADILISFKILCSVAAIYRKLGSLKMFINLVSYILLLQIWLNHFLLHFLGYEKVKQQAFSYITCRKATTC